MMNVEALKTLYVKLGGSLTDTYSDIAGGVPVSEYDLIADCILACSKKASSGGGSSLPAAGADGNVLTADNGEWVSAAPASDDFVLTAELTIGDTFEVSNPSKTLAECLAAKNAGKNVRMLCINDTYGVVFDARMTVKSNVALFAAMSYISPHWYSFNILYSDTLTVTACMLLDPPTSDDNGKVLGVDNGAYALVDQKPLIVPCTIDTQDYVTGTATIPADAPSLADIYTAADAGRTVYLEFALGTGNKTRLALAGYTYDNDEYELSFSAASVENSKPAAVECGFENSKTGTFARAVLS